MLGHANPATFQGYRKIVAARKPGGFGGGRTSVARHFAILGGMPAEDTEPLPTLRTIVVAVDGSELSTYALRVAARVATLDRARVIAVHVRHVAQAGLGVAAVVGSVDTSEFYDAAADVAKQAKESVTRTLGGAGLAGWTYEERTGSPINEVLVEAINEHDADLVVVGSHGHNPLYDLVVGSTAQGLLTQAPVSVLVARPNQNTSRSD